MVFFPQIHEMTGFEIQTRNIPNPPKRASPIDMKILYKFFFFNYGILLVKLRLLTLDEISNVKELTLDSSDAFELKKNVISCFKTSNSVFQQIHGGHGLVHNL